MEQQQHGQVMSLDSAQVGMESAEQLEEVEERPPLKIVVLGDALSGRGSQRNAKARGSGRFGRCSLIATTLSRCCNT